MNSKQHNMIQYMCSGCHQMYYRRASSQKLCYNCRMERRHRLKKAQGQPSGEGGPEYRKEVWATVQETLLTKPDCCPKCLSPEHNLNVEFVMAYNDGRDVGWACMMCGFRVVPTVPSHFENLRDPTTRRKGTQIEPIENL